MKVHDSALKHGVRPEDAVQAADWPLWVEPLGEDDWPHRELRLGFDTQARLLETVVLIFESGEEMIIPPCQPASSTGTSCRNRPAHITTTGSLCGHPLRSRAWSTRDH